MKFRRALGLTAVGLGATVAVNRTLRSRGGVLEPALSGDQRTYRWRGMDIAYTEAGDPENRDIVLLHGINAAGSSGEYRELFSALAEDFHVVAPDLPGFGCSDRPPLRYSTALYEEFVRDFLSEFDQPAVVASSLTGAYVAAVADDEDISHLILICPTTTAGPEPNQTLRELVRAPLVGELAFNAVTSKPAIRYFNADHAYYDPSTVSAEWREYVWRTSHQRNARFAPASFISGYLNSEVDLAAALGELDVPVTLAWGREADLTPLSDGRDLAAEANVRLVVFDDSKLLPHAEHPSLFLETIRKEFVDAS